MLQHTCGHLTANLRNGHVTSVHHDHLSHGQQWPSHSFQLHELINYMSYTCSRLKMEAGVPRGARETISESSASAAWATVGSSE